MKLVRMSLAAALAMSAVMAGGDIAPVEPVVETPEVKADYGTVFGQARAFYIDRTYDPAGATVITSYSIHYTKLYDGGQ